MEVEDALSKLQNYSEELDLDLTKAEDRFKWFLSSVRARGQLGGGFPRPV